jgi:hypothetical protein
VQSCQGNTVAAGASCQMTFRFATTSSGPQTGTASGAWNDVPFSIALTGRGIGEDQGGGTIDGRVEFLPPLGKRPRVKAGSTLTVRFRLLDEDGVRISRAEAQALDQSCALRITFSGGNADPGCTRYQNGRVFRLQLKTSRALAPGTYTVGVQLASNGSSETVGAVEIVIF